MRKIKLTLDRLSVESFEIVETAARRGTVEALMPPTPALSCVCSEPSCVPTGCQVWQSCVVQCS